MQVSRSIVSFSKFGACCCRGSAASPCARIKPHDLAVTARRPPGPVGVVAGLLGVSNYGTRPFVAQERGKNHQLQHWLSSAPNISFQATLRKKPRKAPELHRSASSIQVLFYGGLKRRDLQPHRILRVRRYSWVHRHATKHVCCVLHQLQQFFHFVFSLKVSLRRTATPNPAVHRSRASAAR